MNSQHAMDASSKDFLSAVSSWLCQDDRIESAVLFGSMARNGSAPPAAMADVDLHAIAARPAALHAIDWKRELPHSGFVFQVMRPATGGMRKITALFASGQIDLVVVPALVARLGILFIKLGLHRRYRAIQVPLNEMATCLHPGYRFLKGEKKWAKFYTLVAAEMTGVRISDDEAQRIANVFLVDFLWVGQKLHRGELIAAQHVVHRHLSETNLRLFRELRARRGAPLASFGLGRRLEEAAAPAELEWLRVDASLDRADLEDAAVKLLEGLRALMGELVPTWRVPVGLEPFLVRREPAPTPAP